MTGNTPLNTNPALATLKDIQLPQVTGFWPLAPGYWILLAIVIILSFCVVVLIFRRHKVSIAKKQALRLLTNIDLDDSQYATKVNTLIKRTALSYLPRTQVAALDGDKWYQLLDLGMPKKHHGQLAKLLSARFSQHPLSLSDNQQLQQLASIWLKQANTKKTQAMLAQEALC